MVCEGKLRLYLRLHQHVMVVCLAECRFVCHERCVGQVRLKTSLSLIVTAYHDV
jgi:hypothetical protein